MQRRSFLKQAGAGALAGSAVVAAPVFAQDTPSLTWRMASAFPRNLEILFGTGEAFCKFVSESTGGKFTIRHFPDGEIVPAHELLDAVSTKKVECGHASSGTFFNKNPAFCFDAAAPFGLNLRQMNAWMYEGDGMRLTRELFKPLKIINFPLGNTGTQAGGWYRKEIKRAGDLKDLKMQVDGIAAAVLSRLGVAPQQLALAEVVPALEKNTLDAAVVAGPYDDEKLGLNRVAKFYYAPAWWAGSEQMSLYVNNEAWSTLPKSYQAALDAASRAAHTGMTARYDSQNPLALQKLTAAGAQVRAFPRAIVDTAFEASEQLYKELCDKDPKFKALHDSYMGARDSSTPWFRMTASAYDQYLGVALAARR